MFCQRKSSGGRITTVVEKLGSWLSEAVIGDSQKISQYSGYDRNSIPGMIGKHYLINTLFNNSR